MYLINATLEVIDDQNESYTIKDSGASFVNINEDLGTIVLYTDVSKSSNTKQTTYTVNKIPCTIYRNLKKIVVKRGKQIPWKYIKFNSDSEVR